MRSKDLIAKFAREESTFEGRQFLAPALCGGPIKLRLNGVACELKFAPDDFEGFGIFETISFTEAILVREASIRERQDYLNLFPKAFLIATKQSKKQWYGTALRRGDRRINISGLVPIGLPENVNLFTPIECRFDGAMFLFDRLHSRVDPRHADRLRKALTENIEPGKLSISGLSAEMKAAYELNFVEQTKPMTGPQRRLREMAETKDSRNRVVSSLSHAGAELINLREQHGLYQVTYRIAGRRFVSAVDKKDLNMISAGVCLAGQDQKFDLASVVGVLREGMTTNQV